MSKRKPLPSKASTPKRRRPKSGLTDAEVSQNILLSVVRSIRAKNTPIDGEICREILLALPESLIRVAALLLPLDLGVGLMGKRTKAESNIFDEACRLLGLDPWEEFKKQAGFGEFKKTFNELCRPPAADDK